MRFRLGVSGCFRSLRVASSLSLVGVVFQVKVGVSAAAIDPVGGFRARGVSVEGWVPRQRPRKFAVEHEEKCWWVRCTEFGGGKVGDGMGGFR